LLVGESANNRHAAVSFTIFVHFSVLKLSLFDYGRNDAKSGAAAVAAPLRAAR
jgi:hypothetical protein